MVVKGSSSHIKEWSQATGCHPSNRVKSKCYLVCGTKGIKFKIRLEERKCEFGELCLNYREKSEGMVREGWWQGCGGSSLGQHPMVKTGKQKLLHYFFK